MNILDKIDIKEFPKIPHELAKLYKSKKEILLLELEKAVTTNSILEEMTKNTSSSLIFDLHRYHTALFLSMIELNNSELFIRSLPWEYRAYHNQGLDYEYFSNIYKLWQKVISSVFDETSAQKINQIYKWLSTVHKKIIILSEDESTYKNVCINTNVQKSLLKIILKGDHNGAQKLCQGYLDEGNTLTGLFNNVIQPTMTQIGLLWETGKITSAYEHLATALITKTLSILYSKGALAEQTKGVAVVTAAPNEFHELGAWMVATALEDDGWRVHYLGANTPAIDLLNLLKETKADILAISSVVIFHLDSIKELIDNIRQDSELEDIKIMIGGRAFDTTPEIVNTMKADEYLTNADDAVTKAREWYERD